MELKAQRQFSTHLTVRGGKFTGRSGKSFLRTCGRTSTSTQPALVGESVGLASKGTWASGDIARYFSVRAYVYHGQSPVANGFGVDQTEFFTLAIPIFSGAYTFDSRGEYIIDCEL